MLHMPISDIVKKISEEAKLPEDEIKELIKRKTDAHEGLVSEEGAAHIVAHDLNVELFKTPTETSGTKMKIKETVIGMNNFEIVGKVSNVFPVREFQKQGKTSQVGNFNLRDETETTRVVLWDQKANIIREGQLQVGQVVKIRNGNVKSSDFSPNGKEIHLTIRSQMIIDADEEVNVSIDEPQAGKEREIISVKISEISADKNVKIRGTVVRVFPPAFYDACPQCGKKVIDNKCREHNKVESEPAMVFSIVLDDGTGAVRCTAFRDTADKLAGISGKEAKEKTENPVLLQEELDNTCLGKEMEVQGTVRENRQFDRTEITINSARELKALEVAKALAKE